MQELHAQAAEPESDDDDGLLQRVQDEDGDEGQGDGPTRELLEQVFDPSDEKDCFLKDYIASKVHHCRVATHCVATSTR